MTTTYNSRGVIPLTVVLICAALLTSRPEAASLRLVPLDLDRPEAPVIRSLSGAGPGVARRWLYLRTLDPGFQVRWLPGVGSRRLHTWWPWIANPPLPTRALPGSVDSLLKK